MVHKLNEPINTAYSSVAAWWHLSPSVLHTAVSSLSVLACQGSACHSSHHEL